MIALPLIMAASAQPNVVLPPWQRILGVFVAVPLMLGAQAGIFILFPCWIEVTRRRICLVGPSTFAIDADRLIAVEIESIDGASTLVVRYWTRLGRERQVRLGIAESVDLAQLANVLHVPR
jgi:hypothetical protein